ncbi:tape measure protein [Spirosoma sp. 209]|uniref:tape measure protein n=1 Tax=Spirosoma sp. 209 TaxID=1955701 RepID=UPI00098D4820|nr:tape measure protein [Spirosoma sp. 209]
MLRNLTVLIDADIARFQAALANVSGGLQGFAQKAQTIGTTLSVAISAPLALLGKRAIETFGEMDSLRRGLATLEKDATALQNRLGKLNEIAKLPGLGMKETIAGDIRLRTVLNSIYGVEKAADMSERTLKGFGNAVALVGKGKVEFGRALYGVQQLANTPFPLGEDLNIIKDAIPQVTPLLNAAFGTSRSDDFKKLGVSSKQVMEVILDGLEKLPKASGGAKNAFENFGDTTTRAFDGVGQTLFKALHIEGFLNAVGDAITKLADKFNNMPATTQTLVSAFGLIAIALPPLIAGIGFFTTTILPALRAGMLAVRTASMLMLGPIGLIAAAIAAAAILIIMHWDKVKAALVDSGVWTQLKGIVSSALGVITSIFGAFANLFQGDWEKVWEHLKNVAKYAWNGIVAVVGTAILAMGGLVAKALSLFGLTDWSTAVSDEMDEVEKRLKDRKFDIAAPKFDLFQGFNFGGEEPAKGKSRPAALAKKGKKEKVDEDYSYIDYLQQRIGEVQKEIQSLSLLDPDSKNLDDLRKSLRFFSDELAQAENSIKKVDLGKLKEMTGIRVNKSSLGDMLNQFKQTGPVKLPGLLSFQTNMAEQARAQRLAIQKELTELKNNLSDIPVFFGGLRDSLSSAGSDMFTDTASKVRSSVAVLAEVFRQAKEALRSGAVDAFGGLAEGLAAATVNVDSGKEILRSVLKSIIDLLANQAITIGKAMILTGIPFLSNPLTAALGTKQLLTGGALVVAGGVAKGLASTAFAEGGLVYGPTNALIGEGIGTNARNPEVVAPLDKLKSFMADNGGGGGVLTTRVSGADLELILTRHQRSKYTYGI